MNELGTLGLAVMNLRAALDGFPDEQEAARAALPRRALGLYGGYHVRSRDLVDGREIQLPTDFRLHGTAVRRIW